jgi:protein-tyrosine phosphatase
MKLDGAPNFRDFGGDWVEDGRRVRRGLLYRSGALGQLTASDQERLASIGLRLTVDLRSAHEREAFPSGLTANLLGRYLTPDTETGLEPVGLLLRRLVQERADATGGRDVMLATFAHMPRALV